jgi:hypothetical protein
MTTRARYFRCFLGPAVLIGLLTAVAAQQPRKDGQRKDIEAQFHDGKAVVLVVAPTVRKPSDADEAYGDWADGLNNFATHAGAGVKILKLTPLGFTQLLLQPKVKGDFATLFMRDPDHALVYNGMVVERKVYEIGLAYLKRQMDEKLASAYGLQEEPADFK